jgi:hypothetical protein
VTPTATQTPEDGQTWTPTATGTAGGNETSTPTPSPTGAPLERLAGQGGRGSAAMLLGLLLLVALGSLGRHRRPAALHECRGLRYK